MVDISQIDDAADPRIAEYLAVRDRDVAGRQGRFVAEGEVVVRTLLSSRSRFRPDSVLLSESRIGLLDRLAGDLPAGLPVYRASRPVMDRIVGFPIHRGILAIGRRGMEPAPETLLPEPPAPALVLGLVGLANHDNVGGLFRNAAAFRAEAVLLDATSCDPLYRKAIRVSTGAALTMPFGRCADGARMIGLLEAAGFTPFGLSPSGAVAIEDVAWPPRAALIVGAEGPGLPPDLLARIVPVRIRMAAGHDSLNVASAAAVALHALHLAARRAI